MTSMYTPPLGLKNKTINQEHCHHHQGQNRPHQNTITHPQGPSPPEPAELETQFFSWSEGLIGPPLPCLNCRNVPVVGLLLYDWHYQNQRTVKDEQV